MIFFILWGLASGWDYTSHGEDWGGFCGEGRSQSPINIQTTQTTKIGTSFNMVVYYYGQTISRTVVNNGNYIYIEGNFGYITITDFSSSTRKFNSYKIEFHVPSEHYIDGYPTHMELQIFHQIDDSDYTFNFPTLAVVSVILRPGDPSYFFDSINVSNLPGAGNNTVLSSTANVNLLSIVVPNDNYFFYNGSLNEPDCQEDVLWYVFQTQQWISMNQIQQFKNLFIGSDDVFNGGGDTRAIQNLNSRVVYYSYGCIIEVILGILIF
jgi:carbonic anhydrase